MSDHVLYLVSLATSTDLNFVAHDPSMLECLNVPANLIASHVPQASVVEVTPSLSRALIDTRDGDLEVTTLQGHMDTVSCLSAFGMTIFLT